MSTILIVLLILVLAGAFGGASLGALNLSDPMTLIIIILAVVLLGGGGYYWRRR